MNKKIPMSKRVGAILLCLTMLCGAIVGAGVFSLDSLNAQAGAEANVEKFEADFADLAALVDTAKWDATTNRYRPVEADAAIQNWINARFGLYVSREASSYKPYSFLGQSSFATGVETSDGWSGEYWWEVTKDGGLYSYTGNLGGQMLRKSNAVALKYADGELMQLSNFEANVVFSKADDKLGSVWLSFHQLEPGRMTTNTNTGENSCNGTAAIIGNGPLGTYNNAYRVHDKDGITFGSLSGKDDRAMEKQFAANLELNVDYNLYVKVVGIKMTVKVTKVSDGSVVYSGETSIPAGNGYIAVGSSNNPRVIRKIQVTELDAAGNPVNIGITRAFKWTTSGKTGYANGKHTYNTEDTADDKDWFDFAESANAGKADKTSIIDALNTNFDIYYNCEASYYQMQAGDKLAYSGQTGNYGWFRGVYEDRWLQRPVGSAGGDQNMRLITSLVPKVSGQALAYQNFETTFNVRLDNADAAFVFGFRQQTPGKFTNGYFNVNKEQGLVVVSKTGITVSGGEDIFSGHTNHVSKPGDMYDGNATATFATALSGANTITVKAVGNQVYVKVKAGSSGATVYEATHTVNYTKPGYLAYGVANRGSDLGEITLTHLDAEGNKMATNAFTYEEEAMYAEFFSLSFTDLPGATYTGGVYTKTNQNWINFSSFADTQAIDHISAKVDYYFNHEDQYAKVDPYGHASNAAGPGNWLLFYNNWLQRSGSAGWGERLRQINAIVPKDNNGVQAQMKNLLASFEYRFEGDGDGAAVFGFRQKNPGKFVNHYNNPNQEGVIVAITRKSIAVAGGKDITKERFYHYNQFADDAFGDVFTADLPQQIVVKVQAIGKDIAVEISDYSNGKLLYSGTFKTDYVDEGYMAFGVAATGGNIGDLMVKRLDDKGVAIDFTDDSYLEPTFPDGKTRFVADFATLNRKVGNFSGTTYTPTMDDTAVNSWMESKFGMFGVRETTHISQLTYLGQPSSDWDGEAASKAAQWKITNNGGLYMNLAGSHGEMLRKSQNLVPKLSDGNLAKLKNFEAEVVFNKNGAHSFGAVYVSFHEKVAGKFDFNWKGASSADVVDGVIVGNGETGKYAAAGADGITAGNVRDNDNRYMRTKFSENLDNSADYKLWVKVVGTKLDWSVTKVGETTAFASGTETIADTSAGYISIGGRNRTIKSIIITELNTKGEVVDYGTRGVGYNPENTTVYNFDSADELKDFESWYLPSTNGTNIPAIHTEGTTDDNWVVQGGALTHKANSLSKGNAQMAEGVTFPQYNDYTYKDDRAWAGYASNHAIAVLKTRTFKNFILDVDAKVNSRWAPIGFGAQDFNDPYSVHATSENGGYSFHVETGANSTGTAKMWGYFADEGTSKMFNSTGITGYSASNYNHFRIVVSDGVAMLYINYSDAPVITYNLPTTYDGGYVYFSNNSAGNAFDNLRIVDLDKEPIVITDIVTNVQDIEIDREKGESLSGLPRNLTVADANGFEYDIAATWVSTDYRSWKEGTSNFTLDTSNALHNFDLTALAGKGFTVTNKVGNAYDKNTSRKYYFDHENDLLDFYMQESKHGYEYKGVYEPDYHSMYSGIMVENNDLFQISNGKVTQKKNATGVGGGWTELQAMRGVASAVLKDVNFYNFKLELDFTHSGMWYTYGLIGVQDPLVAHKRANWQPDTAGRDYDDRNADGTPQWKLTDIGRVFQENGGVWIHNEQEGYINVNGSISGGQVRTTKNINNGDIKVLYDKTVPHHMTITVIDGLVTVMIDKDELQYVTYAALNEDAIGGLVGFATHRHGGTVDNFQITALDANGNPLDWADAVEGVDKGFAPAPIPDNYLGWKPKDDFVWGSEYED